MKSLLKPCLLAIMAASIAAVAGIPASTAQTPPADKPAAVHIRINQIGYLPDDPKVAIAFGNAAVDAPFVVLDEETGEEVHRGALRRSEAAGWGRFSHFYEADFSDIRREGRYRLVIGGSTSTPFGIGSAVYAGAQEDLLEFMRQQRCGYNPFLDMVCHRHDGRSAYGPMPESTYVDVSGGWHDAGDQLKYLLTSSWATGAMLLSYDELPDRFEDRTNDLGQDGANGIPDVLDEAKWGLDWMHRLHTGPDQLVHQIADDRDHRGWKWPNRDSSDYGWGPMSYRVAYFATGEPQGLGQYKSVSDGVGNLAGRYAAAMAMASRIWGERGDTGFAEKSLEAARSIYDYGKRNEGVQQGNSYGAPYRYGEVTWADDMEWGAAEMYRATGEPSYLEDAKRYARIASTTSWMGRDTTAHYEQYPFINFGHFALYPLVDEAFKDTLAAYYRDGLDKSVEMGRRNPYNVGVPFIWCSNNLMTALVTQGLLYEMMTGDDSYRAFITAQRDWLFGRNPWGTTMFTGMPRDGEYPEDVHTSVYALTGRMVPGGLVDGPVYRTIFESLIGLELTEPDEFEPFQNDFVVYHDDVADFSTNEPTMDGTAGAIFMMAFFGTDLPPSAAP